MWNSIKKMFNQKGDVGNASSAKKSPVEKKFDELTQKVEADEKVLEALKTKTERDMRRIEKAVMADCRQAEKVLVESSV